MRRGAKWKPAADGAPAADLKAAIRAELEADGCSQKDLAGYLGLSEKHVSQVLTGQVIGTLWMLEKMAAAVGLSVNFQPQREVRVVIEDEGAGSRLAR